MDFIEANKIFFFEGESLTLVPVVSTKRAFIEANKTIFSGRWEPDFKFNSINRKKQM